MLILTAAAADDVLTLRRRLRSIRSRLRPRQAAAARLRASIHNSTTTEQPAPLGNEHIRILFSTAFPSTGGGLPRAPHASNTQDNDAYLKVVGDIPVFGLTRNLDSTPASQPTKLSQRTNLGSRRRPPSQAHYNHHNPPQPTATLPDNNPTITHSLLVLSQLPNTLFLSLSFVVSRASFPSVPAPAPRKSDTLSSSFVRPFFSISYVHLPLTRSPALPP